MILKEVQLLHYSLYELTKPSPVPFFSETMGMGIQAVKNVWDILGNKKREKIPYFTGVHIFLGNRD